MTIDEFKFIFYMEWSHRMWGRFMGLAFALPGLYFLFRGRLTPQLKKQVAIMFTLGGVQGEKENIKIDLNYLYIFFT